MKDSALFISHLKPLFLFLPITATQLFDFLLLFAFLLWNGLGQVWSEEASASIAAASILHAEIVGPVIAMRHYCCASVPLVGGLVLDQHVIAH